MVWVLGFQPLGEELAVRPDPHLLQANHIIVRSQQVLGNQLVPSLSVGRRVQSPMAMIGLGILGWVYQQFREHTFSDISLGLIASAGMLNLSQGPILFKGLPNRRDIVCLMLLGRGWLITIFGWLSGSSQFQRMKMIFSYN